jgi:hypothetical protein
MSEDFDGPAEIDPNRMTIGRIDLPRADYVQVIAPNGKDDWSVPKEIKNPYENPKDRVGSKKLPYWVVPDTAIMHLTMGMRDGGYKYGPHNYRETAVVAMIYADAMLRHIACWKAGEDYADDSNVHHLGHAMACAAILIDTMEHGKLIDNRPKSPETLALLKRLHKQIAEEKRDPETGVRIA